MSPTLERAPPQLNGVKPYRRLRYLKASESKTIKGFCVAPARACRSAGNNPNTPAVSSARPEGERERRRVDRCFADEGHAG